MFRFVIGSFCEYTSVIWYVREFSVVFGSLIKFSVVWGSHREFYVISLYFLESLGVSQEFWDFSGVLGSFREIGFRGVYSSFNSLTDFTVSFGVFGRSWES